MATATARKRKSKRRTVARVALELPSTNPQSEPQKESLLGNLRNKLLGSPSDSPSKSQSESGGTISSNLAPDVAAQLAGVPDVIGDSPSGDNLPPIDGGSEDVAEGDGVPAPDGPTVFKVKFVQKQVVNAFDLMVTWRKKSCWKVEDDDANTIAEPLTDLANSLWPKLKALLPEMIAARCEALPGLLEFLMALAMVAGPKVAADFAMKPDIDTEKAKAKLTEVSETSGGPGRIEVSKPVAKIGDVPTDVTIGGN